MAAETRRLHSNRKRIDSNGHITLPIAARLRQTQRLKQEREAGIKPTKKEKSIEPGDDCGDDPPSPTRTMDPYTDSATAYHIIPEHTVQAVSELRDHNNGNNQPTGTYLNNNNSVILTTNTEIQIKSMGNPK